MTKCQFPLTLFWSNCVSNSFLTCCLGYGCNQPLHPEFYVATFWNEVDKEIWAHHERMHSGVPWLQSRLSSLLHTFSLLEVVPHGTKMGYASTFATPTQTQTQVLATSRCTRIGQNESKIRHRPSMSFVLCLGCNNPAEGKCWWQYVHHKFIPKCLVLGTFSQECKAALQQETQRRVIWIVVQSDDLKGWLTCQSNFIYKWTSNAGLCWWTQHRSFNMGYLLLLVANMCSPSSYVLNPKLILFMGAFPPTRT